MSSIWNNKERNLARKIQDKAIKILQKKDYSDNNIIINDFKPVTLKNLKDYIYPEYTNTLKRYIADNQRFLKD